MEDHNLKKSIIATLMKLSSRDNVIEPLEYKFIWDVAQKIGISQQELGTIISQHEDLQLDVPKAEQDRMTILYYLLFLMKIDGNASEKEQAMVREIGVRLGFRDQMVDNMVDIIKKYESSNIPKDSLLDSIKKYLN